VLELEHHIPFVALVGDGLCKEYGKDENFADRIKDQLNDNNIYLFITLPSISDIYINISPTGFNSRKSHRRLGIEQLPRV
jgi:hypothetical protein